MLTTTRTSSTTVQDHYNFAKKGIPVIFYFSGVHEDYHKPGDTIDKIEFDLLDAAHQAGVPHSLGVSEPRRAIVVDGKVEE